MKKRNFILCFYLIMSMGLKTSGQQIVLYQQSLMDFYPVNPAYAGFDSKIHLNLCYSKQYVGITQSPQSYYLSVYSKLGQRPAKVYKQYSLRISQPAKYNSIGKPKSLKIKHGMGAIVSSDAYGQMKRLNTGLSYSFHYQLNSRFNAAIGISTGLVNFSFNKDGLIADVPDDETLDQFITKNYSTSFINLNAGIMIYSDKWRFSYSAHQLMGNQIWFRTEKKLYEILLHHFISANYDLSVNSGKLKVSPGIMLRYLSGLDPLVEINSMFYTGNYWGGIAFRINNSAYALLGLNYNKFRFGYSYSLNINSLYNSTSGSHEILMGMDF